MTIYPNKVYLLTRQANFENECDYVEKVFYTHEKAEQYLFNLNAEIQSYKYRGKKRFYYSIKNEDEPYTANYLIIEKEVEK